jgi:carbamoyltransferase
VDYSARIQTVHPETNERFYRMIQAFYRKTGCPVIINTSFNVRGEPIVESPEDAYRCFMRTEMDYLVMGSYLLDKKSQPPYVETKDWRKEFQLD